MFAGGASLKRDDATTTASRGAQLGPGEGIADSPLTYHHRGISLIGFSDDQSSPLTSGWAAVSLLRDSPHTRFGDAKHLTLQVDKSQKPDPGTVQPRPGGVGSGSDRTDPRRTANRLQEKIQSGETWIALGERAGGGAGSQEAFGTGERNQPSLRSAREAIGGTCRAQAAG
jgi:hypothetical protein